MMGMLQIWDYQDYYEEQMNKAYREKIYGVDTFMKLAPKNPRLMEFPNPDRPNDEVYERRVL